TSYLKANYPTEFFLGMLNAWPMGFYPPATLVHDARRHGVVVLPPCLKTGEWECTLAGANAVPAQLHPVTESWLDGQSENVLAQRTPSSHPRRIMQPDAEFARSDSRPLLPPSPPPSLP